MLCSSCGGANLSAKALSQQAKSLQSLAAEGALLGHDAAAGKATGTFTRVHSSDLEKTASQTASSLRTAKTAPGLEPKLRRLAILAGKVDGELKRLRSASKDEQRSLAGELQADAQETMKIGEGLKRA